MLLHNADERDRELLGWWLWMADTHGEPRTDGTEEHVADVDVATATATAREELLWDLAMDLAEGVEPFDPGGAGMAGK